MKGRQFAIIIMAAAGAAIAVVVALRLIGIEGPAMIGGVVAGGVSGAIAGNWVSKSKRA